LGNGHIAAMNAIYQVLDERHHQKTLISRREICYIDPAVLELLVCCSFCFFNNFSRFCFIWSRCAKTIRFIMSICSGVKFLSIFIPHDGLKRKKLLLSE